MTDDNNNRDDDTDGNNMVRLIGRVSADPDTRVMPSGDEVVSFRLIVTRSRAARRRSKQLVDTFDCSAWTSALRRKVAKLEAGTVVEVSGALRRQFFRGASGPMSRVTVDLDSCKKSEVSAVASGA